MWTSTTLSRTRATLSRTWARHYMRTSTTLFRTCQLTPTSPTNCEATTCQWTPTSPTNSQAANSLLVSTNLPKELGGTDPVIVPGGDLQQPLPEVHLLHRAVDERLVPCGIRGAGYGLCAALALLAAATNNRGKEVSACRHTSGKSGGKSHCTIACSLYHKCNT